MRSWCTEYICMVYYYDMRQCCAQGDLHQHLYSSSPLQSECSKNGSLNDILAIVMLNSLQDSAGVQNLQVRALVQISGQSKRFGRCDDHAT
jgi:hypothetical protein